MILAASILFFGKIGNNKSKGKLLVVGYFGCAIGAVLLLLVRDQTSLILALAINAIAGGMSLPAHKALFAKNESLGRESEQWSWLDAGATFSAAAGSALGGIVIGLYGFQGIFVAMASIQFVAAIVAYRAIYRLQ